MGGLFGKAPKPPEPTPIPVQDDEEQRRKRLEEIGALQKRTGKSSNFMSGALGSLSKLN